MRSGVILEKFEVQKDKCKVHFTCVMQPLHKRQSLVLGGRMTSSGTVLLECNSEQWSPSQTAEETSHVVSVLDWTNIQSVPHDHMHTSAHTCITNQTLG